MRTKEEYSQYFKLKVKPDADCVIYVDDERVAEAVCDKISKLELHKGSYLLRFESQLYPPLSKEQIYRVEDIDTEELLQPEIKDEILRSIPDDQLEPYICDGGCGFSYNGVKVLSLSYNYARAFSEGFALVKFNDKAGYIDKTGEVVIPLIYDGIWIFQEGLACASLNDRADVIDKHGNGYWE